MFVYVNMSCHNVAMSCRMSLYHGIMSFCHVGQNINYKQFHKIAFTIWAPCDEVILTGGVIFLGLSEKLVFSRLFLAIFSIIFYYLCSPFNSTKKTAIPKI